MAMSEEEVELFQETAMKQDYTDIVEDLSQLLSTAIQEREINLADSVSQLDGELAELLGEK